MIEDANGAFQPDDEAQYYLPLDLMGNDIVSEYLHLSE